MARADYSHNVTLLLQPRTSECVTGNIFAVTNGFNSLSRNVYAHLLQNTLSKVLMVRIGYFIDYWTFYSGRNESLINRGLNHQKPENLRTRVQIRAPSPGSGINYNEWPQKSSWRWLKAGRKSRTHSFKCWLKWAIVKDLAMLLNLAKRTFACVIGQFTWSGIWFERLIMLFCTRV